MTAQNPTRITNLTAALTAFSSAVSLTFPDLMPQTFELEPDEFWKAGNPTSVLVEMQKALFNEAEREELRTMILDTARLLFTEINKDAI